MQEAIDALSVLTLTIQAVPAQSGSLTYEVTRSALRQQAAASQKGGLPSYYVPPTGF